MERCLHCLAWGLIFPAVSICHSSTALRRLAVFVLMLVADSFSLSALAGLEDLAKNVLLGVEAAELVGILVGSSLPCILIWLRIRHGLEKGCEPVAPLNMMPACHYTAAGISMSRTHGDWNDPHHEMPA